ncbi:PilZ domain-containing protein [Marilutibacter spongiae]|uniref:PilZ domain-containing protein n=1 Tax=Marilutibacter spongiae TaxID=2025720 RepID=A0A7W3TJ81_9GAMM|nr:PilZ domain-containing protein [Lysobacter spongiae]MBB1059352.1 PilZ domain-containing protein [Lysobacter spongiae]
MDDAHNDDERRIGDRTPFHDRVMVVRAEQAWYAELMDLSEGGCGIAVPPDSALEEEQVVRLFFYEAEDKPAVIVPARVARVTDARIGFEYHEPQSVPPKRRA